MPIQGNHVDGRTFMVCTRKLLALLLGFIFAVSQASADHLALVGIVDSGNAGKESTSLASIVAKLVESLLLLRARFLSKACRPNKMSFGRWSPFG